MLGNCSPPCSTSSLGQNGFSSMATSSGYHQQSHQQASGAVSNGLPSGFHNIVVSDTSAHDHARQMQLQQQQEQQSQMGDDGDSSDEFEKMGEIELNTRELAQRIS